MSSVGYCKYCGSGRMVEMPEGVSQEALDREASETCDCYGAEEARKKRDTEGCLRRPAGRNVARKTPGD